MDRPACVCLPNWIVHRHEQDLSLMLAFFFVSGVGFGTVEAGGFGTSLAKS